MDPENAIFTALKSGGFQTFLQHMRSEELLKFTLPEQRTPLHYACQHGRVDIAPELITNFNCSIESKDAEGHTPLHTAAQYGHEETLRYLLHKLFSYEVSDLSLKHAHGGKLSHTLSSMFQQKLSDRHRDNCGNTPLHTACVYGQLAVVEFLAHNVGCDPNYTNSQGLSSLHLAAQHGHLLLVQYLAEEMGSDLKFEEENKRCLSYLAAEGGHLDILRYLVEEKGAHLNFKTSNECKIVTKRGRTLVHTAGGKGQLEVVKYLVEQCGCDPSCKDDNWVTPLHLACQEGHMDIVSYLITDCHCDPNCTTKDSSNTPFHLAACYGRLDVIKFYVQVIKCGADIRGYQQSTPLHYACQHGKTDIAQELITNFNCSIESKDAEGRTPLHIAAQYGQVETLRYLLQTLFSIFHQNLSHRHRDNSGNTPLHTACVYGQLAVVKLLTSCSTIISCDPNSTNDEGFSCLHLAVQHGHLPLVRYLIEVVGSDLTLKGGYNGITPTYLADRDNKGFTPLHLACQKGHTNIVLYLITVCHYISSDDSGDKPLHLAACYAQLDLVKVLIEVMKCDPNLRGYLGNTPLHCASANGHLDVVHYLVKACHCDLQRTNELGHTPLHYAASGGEIEVVKFFLLTPGVHLLPRDKSNNTPLHCAAYYNKLNVVKFYIDDMKCDPNIGGRHGWGPLHIALGRKALDVSMYIVNLPNCRYWVDVCNPISGGFTNSLVLAMETNSIEMVRYLCSTCRLDPYLQEHEKHLFEFSNNADILQLLHDYTDPLSSAAANGDFDSLQYSIEKKGWDPLKLDRYGLNALHYAAQNGQLKVVEYFTQDGKMYDLNSRDLKRNTPLHHASLKGHLDIIKYLIGSGLCDPLCRNSSGSTSLHFAARHNHLHVVTYLIEIVQNDPNVKDLQNLTPLHVAINNGHLEVAMYLIDIPHCSILSAATDGVNPLLLAVKKQRLEIVAYLCRTRRIDPYLLPARKEMFEATDDHTILEFLKNYPDPLHTAAVCGDIEIVKYYIEREKWDPLKPDRYGNNTLHNAAQHGRLEVIQYLTGLSKDPISEGVEILCDPLVKNKYGLTALDIASQNGHRHVVSYLLRATSNQLISEPDILSPVLSIFVVGNSGSGKSTLVKALSSENNLLGGMVKVKGVKPLTAGIVPISSQSKVFGRVNIFDFAGHEEYYASHEMILSQAIQPLVILAVNISLPEHDIKKQVLYWLTILTDSLSRDARKAVHVLIVGSHADQIKFLKKKEVYQHVTTWAKDGASLLKYHGFIQCDCRYPSSDNLRQLRLKLAIICKSIRLFLLANESDNSNKLCAALMYHLEHNKPQQATVTVRELFNLLTESISPGSGLAPFTDQKLLLETCKILNSLGHLIFLPYDEREMESVVILDKDTILSKVHASLQAKANLTNKIGILDDADLRKIWSLSLKGILELKIAVKYLIFSQFCTEVSTNQLISVPENFTGLVHYFFPNLVSASRPTDLLPLGDQHYTQFYTWGLECTGVNQFFTPRFLHTLFIQLTKCERDAINAKFVIWKNGILLVHNNGTRSILEVTDQTTRLHLAMQCVEGSESHLVMHRSALIHLVKSLLDKVCPRKLDTKEFLLLPQETYPLNLNSKIPLADVAQSVISGSPTVVFNYKNVPINNLVYFDSFHVIEDLILRDLFSHCQSLELVSLTILNKVLSAVKGCKELVKRLEAEEASQRITYRQLFRELVKYSIFTEGNLYALVGVSTSSETCNLEMLPSVSNMDPLDITDIYFISVNLIEVTRTWEFGRALGLKPHTLEKIKSCYFYSHHVDRCFVEVLAAWLKGEDKPRDSPAPNWGDVVAALKSVHMRDYAQQLVQKLIDGIDKRCVDVETYSSVDNSELASECLGELLEYMYDLGHKWFHLGLSLGLRYSTLKNIEASHRSDVGEQMTEMLKKWLRGVDQEATRGVGGHPSWRTLAMALDCPLVRESQASCKIQRKHTINLSLE